MKKRFKKYIITITTIVILILIAVATIIIIDRNDQKRKIEQDEAQYGDNYKKLEYNNYHKIPDRIIYKAKEFDEFYIFDSSDENFEHLLEVAEDRMAYSKMEDFNLTAFKKDSLDRILSSGQNYIIFDYNNSEENAAYEYENEKLEPIIYKLKDGNRLKRLVSYLSQFRKLYKVADLGSTKFTDTFNKSNNVIADEENGYKLIYTKDDMNSIISNVNGKYKLMNDIDFKDTCYMLRNNFAGEFDGNGYSLKNIKITDNDITEGELCNGIFNTNMGVIKNLNIDNVQIDIKSKVLRSFGILTGVSIGSGSIENCTISGDVIANAESTIAAFCSVIRDNGSIKNCTNKVNINTYSPAGICHYVNDGTIENCTNEGKLQGDSVYGICLDNKKELKNCINKGELIGKYAATGIVYYGSDMNNCHNYGNITVTNGFACGLSIENYGTISDSSNTGNITGCKTVGGLTCNNGESNGTIGEIINCRAEGIIMINDTQTMDYAQTQYVGGITGNHILGSITNTKFNGTVIQNATGLTYKGNYIGAKSTKATIDILDSYGTNYNFQDYYNEHSMETFND